jgi:hypothetical protein
LPCKPPPPAFLKKKPSLLFLLLSNRQNKWFVPADSGCSAEQKTFGIPFRTVPQRRKMLGILFQTIPRKRKQFGISFCGTKIEENPQNSVPKFVSDENMLSILFAGAGYLIKLIF